MKPAFHIYIKIVEADCKGAPIHSSLFLIIWSDEDHRTKLLRNLPLHRINHKDCIGLQKQGIWPQFPSQMQGGPTTLSDTTHYLLLSVCRQHSLTHHLVVSQITENKSAPCSSICITAHKTTVSCSNSSLKPGEKKSPAPLLTGRSQGGPDWMGGLSDKSTSNRVRVCWKAQYFGSLPYHPKKKKNLF